MNKRKEAIAGWVFLSPALVVFLSLVFVPVIASILLSFTKWNFLSGFDGIKWVGFDNFVKLFKRDRDFKTALVNTIVYAVSTVPISIVFALIAAYMLNTKVFLKKFLRMCFFIPYISSMVALSAVFKFLFGLQGPINQIVVAFGGEPMKWLTSSDLCRIPIIAVVVYAGIGFSLIVYMAALQNVPSELYEAAKIDGASEAAAFFKITLPLISPTTFYLLVVRMIAAFKIFTSANIMKYGSNSSGLVNIVYDEAFGNYNFGYASATAWVLVGLILIVTLVQMWGQKKWVHY
ncbi:MAG: sugar ABC transporter permease [Lachnospiraceae bacterium]|nr:sugar ABC transporter permease [Lachnospiraceae bacterium]